MKLQYFNGGLNIREAAHLIDMTEAVELDNVDIAAGELKPINALGAAITTALKYSHYYEFAGEWISSNTKRDYLEYQDILYYTEEGSYPKKYSNSVERRLGIVAPSVAPSVVTITNHPSAITAITLTAPGTGGDLPAAQIWFEDDGGNVHYSGQSTYEYKFVVKAIASDLRSEVFSKSVVASTGATTMVSFSGAANAPPSILDGVIEIYRKYNGKFRYVGIYPTNDNVHDISGNAVFVEEEDINVNGTYNYVYTFYNSLDGTESAPSPLSEDIVVSKGFVEFATPPVSSDPQVTHIRLYRIGGNLGEFTLVDEYAHPVAGLIKDTLSDVDVEGTILESVDYNEAPTGLQFLVEAYGSLIGAVGDKVYYTPAGKPNAWPDTNFIDFEADVTGIGVATNGIIVFSRYKAWVIAGTNSTTFVKYPLSGDQGCIEHKSIVQWSGSIIWASTDGICTTTGATAIVGSKVKLGKIALNPVNAVLFDEEYYLQETDGNVLVLDMRYGGKYKTYNLGSSWLVKALDVLYGWDGTSLKPFFQGDAATFTYLSPEYSEGSLTELKIFKNFYVNLKGSVSITVIIDGVDVITKSYTSDGVYDIMIPQSAQQGHTVQFRITGTGTVREIEYKGFGRQNGR